MRIAHAALSIALGIGMALPVHAVSTIELRGRLTDVTGKPLPGLQVVFRNPTTGVEFKARTDGDGRYRLVNLPVRQYLVLVYRADGRLLFSEEGPELQWRGAWDEAQRWDRSIDPDLDCTVAQPATLAGVVTEPRDALPGVTVRLRNVARPCTQRFAMTDADGRFRFTDLAKGDYFLSAQLQQFAFAVEKIHLEDGQEIRRNIAGLPDYREQGEVLPERWPGPATGVVFDDKCRPLARVLISLKSTESDAPVSFAAAADGSFTPPQVFPDATIDYTQGDGPKPRYRLRFEHPEFTAGVLDLDHNSADFRQNWNVRLSPRQPLHPDRAEVPATVVVSTAPPADPTGGPGAYAGELVGNIVDVHGCPVLGALLTARDRTTGSAWSVESNGMGFRFAGLPAGSYDLAVTKKGFLPVLVDAESLPGGLPSGWSWSVTLVAE